jgi:asparagine synthase (glutamine-hydrolysing)
MTALAAFLPLNGASEPGEKCRRMLSAQQLYAPDRERIWSSSAAALGRRLFRSLPEDAFDHGPAIGGIGRFVVVGDIRLDNREELSAALGLAEREMLRMSDTSIVLRCWERWQSRSLERLVGDFAFVVWDEVQRRLDLVRDPFGQRPLHYMINRDFIAVASMPKGLFALPGVDRRPDADAVFAFLALFPENDSSSFFRTVKKVEQGHVVTFTGERLSSEAFWRPRALPRISRADYAEGLKEVFESAVSARLRGADERIAAQLSGGLDSTAVTATAARLLAPRGGRITAFTAVPNRGETESRPGRFSVEGGAAATVARAYPNIDHVILAGTGASPLERIDRNYFLYDRPYLNLCNSVWLDQLMDAAKAQRLSVMLHGTMGNLSISYSGLPFLSSLLARGRLLRLTRLGFALVRNGVPPETIVGQTLGPFVPRLLWRAMRRHVRPFGGLEAVTILRPELLDLAAARAAARGYDTSFQPSRDSLQERLDKIAGLDVGNYNKGVLGGWGIDLRDPTADRRVVEWCLSAPVEEYLKGGTTRSLARRAFQGIVPNEVLNEHRRGYQDADWQQGFARGLADIRSEMARVGEDAVAATLIDTPVVLETVDAFSAQRPPTEGDVARYRLAILRGASAAHFLRKASGQNR